MNTKLFVALSGVAVLTAACAPLEQAPLIYTSAFQVGLHVGTGPDKTTPEINIGVLKNDAAYVPVAVAKACNQRDATSRDCVDKLYELKILNGDNRVENTNPPPIGVLQAAVRTYELAWANADRAQKMLAAESSASIASAGGTAATSPTTSPSVDQAPVDPNAARVSKAEDAVTLADAELDRAQKNLVEVASGGSGADSTDAKRDALSVYGTFNSDSTAGGGTDAKGGVTIGQVFSTGVASQFLTQGIGASAAASAMANCLSEAHDAVKDIPADKQQSTLDKAISACGLALQRLRN